MSIRPNKQGDLDGMCGLYSIVNSIAVLTQNKKLDTKSILRIAVESLFEDKNKMKIIDGFEIGTLKDVLFRTKNKLLLNGTEIGMREGEKIDSYFPFYKAKFKPTRNEFIEYLKEHITQKNKVAILGYAYSDGEKERYDHWTVVKNASDEGLDLFDSDNEKNKLKWEKILIISNENKIYSHRSKPYLIRPRDLVILELLEGK